MYCKILWSWWAIQTPRPFCNDSYSQKARENSKLQRDASCFWIEDIKTLIDCPESVWHSANKAGIPDIQNLLITHWHPDHTFWLRVVLESKYDFVHNKAWTPVNIYLPEVVYEDIKNVYPSIDFFANTLWCWKINFINDWDELNFWNIEITPVWYKTTDSHRFSYLIKENNKKLLYLPCDTIWFTRDIPKVDILIHECWIFSPEVKDELLFNDLIERIKKVMPWKTILTHIEEIELERYWDSILDELEEKFKEYNIHFAYDWMEIEL